jgi:hypothetical protein
MRGLLLVHILQQEEIFKSMKILPSAPQIVFARILPLPEVVGLERSQVLIFILLLMMVMTIPYFGYRMMPVVTGLLFFIQLMEMMGIKITG